MPKTQWQFCNTYFQHASMKWEVKYNTLHRFAIFSVFFIDCPQLVKKKRRLWSTYRIHIKPILTEIPGPTPILIKYNVNMWRLSRQQHKYSWFWFNGWSSIQIMYMRINSYLAQYCWGQYCLDTSGSSVLWLGSSTPHLCWVSNSIIYISSSAHRRPWCVS